MYTRPGLVLQYVAKKSLRRLRVASRTLRIVHKFSRNVAQKSLRMLRVACSGQEVLQTLRMLCEAFRKAFLSFANTSHSLQEGLPELQEGLPELQEGLTELREHFA